MRTRETRGGAWSQLRGHATVRLAAPQLALTMPPSPSPGARRLARTSPPATLVHAPGALRDGWASPVDPDAVDDELPDTEEPDGPDSQSVEAGRPAAGASTAGEDHDLIRRAQAGEEAAFEKLVKRHQSRAWRVARNMVASDEDAQDLAQEAFLRVFKSLERFDFRHDFTTWLYRIVTNLAIDHLRKRRPTQTTTTADDEAELELVDSSAERPSAAVEREETIEAVRDCLDSLAPHFQSVLVLRELEGLPCNRIAEIVGATHVTVRWRLHRGRKLFQEEWERRARLAESGAGTAPLSRSGSEKPGQHPGGDPVDASE